MNRKQQLTYIENYAFPKILFKNDIKFILKEIDDLSICKEYRHLLFSDIATIVIDNFLEMKKKVAKQFDKKVKEGLETFIPNVNNNFVPCEDKTVICASCGRLGGCECGKYDYRSVYD